jgi:hypothetical protein
VIIEKSSQYKRSRKNITQLSDKTDHCRFDTYGHSVRENLIMVREFQRRAKQYETDYACLKHAKMAARSCHDQAAAAIRRCRSIIARRYAV